ncbi:MAG TPA: response regulator transcription factor [Candidatus Sulfopaludibacter sp.]|nr:response regulator transcription factor [Candidatus Sulfopaludibacter sp.]
MRRTRILLVEEDVLFRETLAPLLDGEADLTVTGQCGSPAEAAEALERAAPDLVLMDVHRDFDAACEFVVHARQSGYGAKVLFVTAPMEPRWSVKALQAGVSGIFPKDRGWKKLLDAIRLVAAGETWVERDVVLVLAGGVSGELSDREDEVLRGVLDGLTNKMIAERLGVPEATVKAALHRLFRRSGVQSRSQLIRATLERR